MKYGKGGGLNVFEIAEILGTSHQNVSLILQGALRKIGPELSHRLDIPLPPDFYKHKSIKGTNAMKKTIKTVRAKTPEQILAKRVCRWFEKYKIGKLVGFDGSSEFMNLLAPVILDKGKKQ